jgi:hypothetical protein
MAENRTAKPKEKPRKYRRGTRGINKIPIILTASNMISGIKPINQRNPVINEEAGLDTNLSVRPLT